MDEPDYRHQFALANLVHAETSELYVEKVKTTLEALSADYDKDEFLLTGKVMEAKNVEAGIFVAQLSERKWYEPFKSPAGIFCGITTASAPPILSCATHNALFTLMSFWSVPLGLMTAGVFSYAMTENPFWKFDEEVWDHASDKILEEETEALTSSRNDSVPSIT